MEFESLKMSKFKENAIKKEQLFGLTGGGMATGGGTNLEAIHGGQTTCFDYGYDAVRNNPDGSTFITYHNRTNIRYGICQ